MTSTDDSSHIVGSLYYMYNERRCNRSCMFFTTPKKISVLELKADLAR